MVNLTSDDISNFLKKKFKELMSSNDKNIIGLDIGQSSVKMIQLSKSGSNYIIEKYFETSLDEGVIIEDEIHDYDKLLNVLIDTHKNGKFSTNNVCFGLWGDNTIVRKIQIPAPDENDDFYDHVLWEAEQYIPFDIDDSYITFHEIGLNEGGGVDLIIAAARKKSLDSFKTIIEEAGLFIKIVDHSAIAILNTFDTLFKDEISTDNSIVLCDLGAQKSFIHILKKGEMNFYKELPIGGQMITEEIQRQMGLTYEEADDLKINGDGSGKIPEEVNIIIEEVLAIFSSNISEIIDFYKSSMSEEVIETFYLSGKTSKLNGCIENIETKTKLSVTRLDLKNHLETKGSLDLTETEIGFGLTGLGLRLFDD